MDHSCLLCLSVLSSVKSGTAEPIDPSAMEQRQRIHLGKKTERGEVQKIERIGRSGKDWERRKGEEGEGGKEGKKTRKMVRIIKAILGLVLGGGIEMISTQYLC